MNSRNRKNRIAAMLLAMVIAFGIVPVNIFATDDSTPAVVPEPAQIAENAASTQESEDNTADDTAFMQETEDKTVDDTELVNSEGDGLSVSEGNAADETQSLENTGDANDAENKEEDAKTADTKSEGSEDPADDTTKTAEDDAIASGTKESEADASGNEESDAAETSAEEAEMAGTDVPTANNNTDADAADDTIAEEQSYDDEKAADAKGEGSEVPADDTAETLEDDEPRAEAEEVADEARADAENRADEAQAAADMAAGPKSGARLAAAPVRAASYGTPTGKSGAANASGNVIYTEYENNGEYILVFSVVNAAGTVVAGAQPGSETVITEEDCAITVKFRNTEFASRTNTIILEEGVTGVGWTYLYDRSNYVPQYPAEYSIDQSKTDIFNSFSKLTKVVPSSTLKRIGWAAFRNCTNLADFDFTLATGLVEIMNQAFSNCKKINTVDFSACGSLELLGWSAFNGAGQGSGASLLFPQGGALAVIGGHAFENFGKTASKTSWNIHSFADEVQILADAFKNCKCISYEVIVDPNAPRTVRYSLVDANGNAFPAGLAGSGFEDPSGTDPAAIPSNSLYAQLPSVVGGAEESGLAGDASHTVRGLSNNFYQKRVAAVNTHFPYHTYAFEGWRTESGQIISAGTELSPVDDYDLDNDGIITLTSVWCGSWAEGTGSTGTPMATFSIWTNVSSANSLIDANVMLAEQIVNYTPSVGGGYIHALDGQGSTVLPSQLKSPSADKEKYLMITYIGSTIVEADAAVRKLASEGYTTDDPRNGSVTWKLASLPSDAEVLEQLAGYVRDGLTVLQDEFGQPISADELTTDNFVVRWCHVKYQSVSNDGWNINGKLTRKMGFTSITKTFYGSDEIVNAAIAGGFNITLSELATGELITLRMVDMRSAVQSFGKIDSLNYGYIERTENPDGSITYKWVVPCYTEKTFSVMENEYSVTLQDRSVYGTRVQYNQTTVSGEKLPWNSDTVIETEVHPSDDTDLSHFTATNFFNTYYPQGSFLINVISTGWEAIPGVEFTITDAAGKVQRLYKAAARTRGEDGIYNMLYENGATSTSAFTNAAGNIFLSLPVPAEGSHTYTIKETIPEGYLGYGEASARAQFTVTVYADGSFSMGGIEMTYGSIKPLSEGGVLYGAQVVNVDENLLPAPTGVSLGTAPYILIFCFGIALATMKAAGRRQREE